MRTKHIMLHKREIVMKYNKARARFVFDNPNYKVTDEIFINLLLNKYMEG